MAIDVEHFSVSYLGNGSTSQLYPITFPFLEASHLRVDKNGVQLSADKYTVSGNNVSTNPAIAPADSLTITRHLPYLQPTVLVNGGPMPAKTLELSLDRVTMLAAQANLLAGLQLSSLESRTEDLSDKLDFLTAQAGQLTPLGNLPALLVIGQSLAAGFGSTGYVSPASSRHWMFNAGTRANSGANADPAKIASLVRLAESVESPFGQTVLSTAFSHFDRLFTAEYGIPSGQWLGTVVAASGQPISAFAPGQYPLARAGEIATRMTQLGGRLAATLWMQGESNNTAPNILTRSAYLASLLAIKTQIQGYAPGSAFCTYQTAGGVGANVETSCSTLAQYDGFRQGVIDLVGPIYPYSQDGAASIHISETGQALFGMAVGDYLFRKFITKTSVAPLHPTEASIVDGYCVLTFSGARGALVLDAENFCPVNLGETKLGFTLHHNGVPVAIGIPEVLPDNRVRFSVPAGLTGARAVRYALDARYPNWSQPPAAAGNLHDSATELGIWRGQTRKLVRHCLAFELPT